MLIEDEVLRMRALAVLDVSEDDDETRIKYAYYRRMFKHHPDKNPDDPDAHEIAALVGEAYALLMGREVKPVLLKNTDLVSKAAQTPVTDLDGVMTYDEWLKNQFYNLDQGSIWSY